MDPGVASVSTDTSNIPIFCHISDFKRSSPWVFEFLIGSGRVIPPHLISNLKLPHPQTTLSSSSVAGSTCGRAPGRSRPRAVGVDHVGLNSPALCSSGPGASPLMRAWLCRARACLSGRGQASSGGNSSPSRNHRERGFAYLPHFRGWRRHSACPLGNSNDRRCFCTRLFTAC